MMKCDDTTLWVKTIHGRNGPFNVADLDTAIGSFKVKDPILDQFEEGRYGATVWIEEIYVGNYIAYGRSVTEIRARLHDIQVLDENQEPVPPEQPEPDPIEEEVSTSNPTVQPNEPQETPVAPDGVLTDHSNQHDAAPDDTSPALPVASDVFDQDTLEAIAARLPIKLDPTIDRAILRQQTKALKEQGYRFAAREQTWFGD